MVLGTTVNFVVNRITVDGGAKITGIHKSSA